MAALAARQHGVVARVQLHRLGFTGDAIERFLARGRLHRIHRGVYAVGHPAITQRGSWMAAVLAGGEQAVLSHRSAAALWRIGPAPATGVEITAGGRRRPRRGIELHHGRLPADERTIVDGIPVTTVPRTLLDLAAVTDRQRLERALHEAEVGAHVDSLSISDLLARYPRRHGAAAVRAILAARARGETAGRNELEERLRTLITDAQLPKPKHNQWLHVAGTWLEADCVWHRQRLIAELDGHAAHKTRDAFERDREHDRTLTANGWRVVRLTWRQLNDEPEAVAADLRALLGA